MLEKIIKYSIENKLVVILFTLGIVGFGLYSLSNISIGAVPDVTNNQVQVITTSRNLSTQDVEQFITYPVELEMANLPGVKEIRSISKFGLSVVTIVFEDKLGTYLPRQLIAEKIKSAEERIPQGFGTPFMGPVSTGLGEIYQYILDVKPEYKDQYSIMDLRTIQDWIVKRQLSGIPGVVEVNTWGGKLKQYEVAINPNILRSMDISAGEVLTALETNNGVAGGSYIEKANESYFIRGEGLVGSIQDIENIIVRNEGGVSIYVKDLAKVHFGSATRFGAITANGEGEKVLGQVMMLKDANSKAVIERVKERVASIEKSLPEGVYINPFLDRSELIGKTTFTVAENLILGCLIVIFVVVILLGNIRSGLVVASVIPLTLLFALSLMYIFGVDANLMSLGAIDFGIIIDGAVIIVEYIAFQITSKSKELALLDRPGRREMIDEISYRSSTKMMTSAVFGQLIIIIVFIPILSLSDVEGKMFGPMALTFCFALLGAMILCFTYVPVMASLFLKPASQGKGNISVIIMSLLKKMYMPTIKFALRFKGVILGLALILLVWVSFIFSRMGAEFVPTLDEGDFVIQPVLKTGTSLSKTIETTTQIEKILKTFPEVKQVVTRIGAAEVPTDPMSMEESDVIITLVPPSEWTSASSKDELADRFKEALSEIPGLDYEFTQPIEMRFNELITGVRADLAIKIFGEDLEVLNKKAQQIKKAIEGVDGAADISVEKVAGLPQMSIKYNRGKIAKYGLNIEEVNNMLTLSFAGLTAGSVFEGEKQFDLVIRYDSEFRKDIDDIKNTTITIPNGMQVPLGELATINYKTGPAKISRDDTKRRIVVGVNVRNRDLESVVEDVQAVLDREIEIPVGYSITYGGQFENLRSARARLLIAVPIALILIFILLFFAFKSVKEALMVYSAIPLSAVGGILLLYVRGMPFSISAGVGFIALFGIAVLNGIVLIEHFKELKAHGMRNINRRILVGTNDRLRPVILTAAAAALGFIPMALSTSAGAEVQRPLATVVVGGLISATLLTLIVLPILYSYFDKSPKKLSWRKSPQKTIGFFVLAIMLPILGSSQSESVSLEEAIELALTNNAGLKASYLETQKLQEQVKTSYDIDPSNFYVGRDQNNIAENGSPITVFGIQQSTKLPSVYKAQKNLNSSKTKVADQQYVLDQQFLKREISKAYYSILFWENTKINYQYLDSVYREFAEAANARYEFGETNYLEKLTAETKRKEMKLQLDQCDDNIDGLYQMLYGWIQHDSDIVFKYGEMEPVNSVENSIEMHPSLQYYQAVSNVKQNNIALQKKQLLPEFQAEYFLGGNTASNARIYNGFQIGMGIPIFRKSQQANIVVAELEKEVIAQKAINVRLGLEARKNELGKKLLKFDRSMQFYLKEGKVLATEIVNTSSKAFQGGEIDYLQHLQALETARNIEMNYLESVLQYNLVALDIQYLLD